MRVKICGITSLDEIEMLNRYRPDYAGFVIYEKSSRFIEPDRAAALFKGLDTRIKKVAVTVSPDARQIRTLNRLGFDIIQIHGRLEYNLLNETAVPVWRAINLKQPDELNKGGSMKDLLQISVEPEKEEDESYILGIDHSMIEAVVLDAPVWGSGKSFSWESDDADEIKRFVDRTGKEFVLAGGLTPGNVAEGISVFEPDVVDVSSGVELDSERIPAGKDDAKIRAFISACNEPG